MPGHNMGGVIANMLKKKEAQNESKVQEHPALPYHTCRKTIEPFTSFPPKKLVYYTSTTVTKEKDVEEEGESDVDEESDHSLGDSLFSGGGDPDVDSGGESLQNVNDDEEQTVKTTPNPGPDNALLYIGLVFIGCGLVFWFTGLRDGDKGFKTLPLQVVGPSILVVGLVLVLIKTIQCIIPSLCGSKNQDSVVDETNLVEKGMANGHLKGSSGYSTPQIMSPRVIFRSTRDLPRPQSTIPNYIEDSSDDENYAYAPAHPPLAKPTQIGQNKNEIVLTPKALNW